MASFGFHCEERSDEAISTVEYVTELMPPNTKKRTCGRKAVHPGLLVPRRMQNIV